MPTTISPRTAPNADEKFGSDQGDRRTQDDQPPSGSAQQGRKYLRDNVISRQGLGTSRARICGDRNLDRHPLKRAAVADKAANHRHYLSDVTSDPTGMRLNPPMPWLVGSKLIQPTPDT